MRASRDAAARHALERLEREGLTIPQSRTVQTFPYGRSDTRKQPPDSTLTHPDRGTHATNMIQTLFGAHPRTALNNVLQSMLDTGMSDRIRWELFSTGTTLAPSWQATMYCKHRFCTPAEDQQVTENSVDDMAYGRGEASTKGGARDAAALDALDNLRRE
jgi:hypothetical protein